MFDMAKQIVKKVLLDFGLRRSPTTLDRNIELFLSMLKPKSTDHNLIRVGGDSDGGYLVPDDLDGIDGCFSPGVSEIANFELELAERGIPCFLADYSVSGPPISHPLIDFEKKFLGPSSTDIHITLESWMVRKACTAGEFILQMDIEGAEYGVLLETPQDVLKKFRIIIIEFHGMDGLVDPTGFELLNLAFSKLDRDFSVVHIHPNNCARPVRYRQFEIPPILEFTFLRRDRISSSTDASRFPHLLDQPNVLHEDDFPLPKCWYQG